MQGPTAQSHWIVPSLICIGPAPDASRTNLTDLQTLIDCGITRYVDLRGPRASNYLKLPGLEDAPDPSNHITFDMAASVSAGRFEAIDACAAFFRGVVGRALEEEAMTYIHAEDGLAYEAAAACGILSAVYGLSGLRALAVASQLHGCRENTEGIVTLIPPTMRPFVKELSTSCMKGPLYSSHAESGGFRGATGAVSAVPLDPSSLHDADYAPPPGLSAAAPAQGAAAYANPAPLTQSAAIGSPAKQRPVPSSAFAAPPPMVGPSHMTSDAVFAPTPVVASPAPGVASIGQLPPPGPSFGSAAAAAAAAAAVAATSTAAVTARPITSRGRNSGGGVTSLCIVGGGASDDAATPTRRGRGARPGSSAGPSTPLVHAAGTSAAGSTPGFRVGADAADPLGMSGTLSLTTTLATAASAAGDSWPPCFDPRVDHALIRGPTPVSNWVVRGRVCCGAAPRASRPREVEALARERFDYLVCLEERDTTADVVDDLWVSNAGGVRPQTLHFPLSDGRAFASAQQAQLFLAFVRSVVASLEAAPLARVYVFCHGGHGRTGMFVSLLLGTIYRLPGMRAVGLCERLHDLRVNAEGQGSPQTQDQRTACISLLAGRGA
jgi:hypothetical protein